MLACIPSGLVCCLNRVSKLFNMVLAKRIITQRIIMCFLLNTDSQQQINFLLQYSQISLSYFINQHTPHNNGKKSKKDTNGAYMLTFIRHSFTILQQSTACGISPSQTAQTKLFTTSTDDVGYHLEIKTSVEVMKTVGSQSNTQCSAITQLLIQNKYCHHLCLTYQLLSIKVQKTF